MSKLESKLGSLGDIVFTVSEDKIYTLDQFTRSASSRWAQHDRIGQKPKKEFIGPGVDTVSFSIRVSAAVGLNPRRELDKLTALERAGKAMKLMLGGKGIGVGLWVITSLSQDWEVIDNEGNVLEAEVKLTLEEYVK